MKTINEVLETFIIEETLEPLPPPSPGKRIGNRIYPDIDQITRKVGSLVASGSKKKDTAKTIKIDVTSVIPSQYNKYNKKLFIKTQHATKQKIAGGNHTTYYGDDVYIELMWSRTFNEYWTTGGGLTYSAFTILKHELVHALDFLEVTKKELEKMGENVNPRYTESSVMYYSDIHEFNQIINAIKEYSRLHPVSWKKIVEFDKIYDIIDKHGNGYVPVDNMLRAHDIFRSKLKKRLKQDGLLPPLLVK